MQPTIEFDNIYRRFGEQQILSGLSLRVQEGQIYAFLGRNGTGKTTALRILMGRLQPHHGTSRVLGKDSTDFGPSDRAAIGYVTEGHQLYPELSVGQTLAFENGTRSTFHRTFALDALGRFGIERRKQVWQLSRGQRAQLSLIITVASSPKILVLDDPALGLDVVVRREFLDAMIDFLVGKGTTLLFSSHILTDVERIADHIGILHGGCLRVDAPMEEIKSRVQLRTWIQSGAQQAPAEPEVLRSLRIAGGFELLLLDADRTTLSRLTRNGAHLSEANTPPLEDLFIHLTADSESGGILSPMHQEL